MTAFTPDLTALATTWATANGWTPPAPLAPAPPAPVPSGLPSTLQWSDEFNGGALDTTKWEYVAWYDHTNTPGDISDHGGGVSDPAHVSVSGSMLTLAASSATPTVPSSWLCGYVDTAPFYAFTAPCYVEVRAQLPASAPGLWPAVSCYEDGDRSAATLQYAEIDILEQVTGGTWATWHPAGTASPSARQIATGDLTAWHTYGVNIDTGGTLQFFFDGNTRGAPILGGANAREPMFISLTMSTGGQPNDGWAGVPTAATPNPVAMHVDYVRVYVP